MDYVALPFIDNLAIPDTVMKNCKDIYTEYGKERMYEDLDNILYNTSSWKVNRTIRALYIYRLAMHQTRCYIESASDVELKPHALLSDEEIFNINAEFFEITEAELRSSVSNTSDVTLILYNAPKQSAAPNSITINKSNIDDIVHNLYYTMQIDTDQTKLKYNKIVYTATKKCTIKNITDELYEKAESKPLFYSLDGIGPIVAESQEKIVNVGDIITLYEVLRPDTAYKYVANNNKWYYRKLPKDISKYCRYCGDELVEYPEAHKPINSVITYNPNTTQEFYSSGSTFVVYVPKEAFTVDGVDLRAYYTWKHMILNGADVQFDSNLDSITIDRSNYKYSDGSTAIAIVLSKDVFKKKTTDTSNSGKIIDGDNTIELESVDFTIPIIDNVALKYYCKNKNCYLYWRNYFGYKWSYVDKDATVQYVDNNSNMSKTGFRLDDYVYDYTYKKSSDNAIPVMLTMSSRAGNGIPRNYRFDFEYKYATVRMTNNLASWFGRERITSLVDAYNKILISTFRKTMFTVVNRGVNSVLSEEELDAIYRIINILSVSQKISVIDFVYKYSQFEKKYYGKEGSIPDSTDSAYSEYTASLNYLISFLSDFHTSLMIPVEFMCYLICIMVLPKHVTIVSDINGSVGSKISLFAKSFTADSTDSIGLTKLGTGTIYKTVLSENIVKGKNSDNTVALLDQFYIMMDSNYNFSVYSFLLGNWVESSDYCKIIDKTVNPFYKNDYKIIKLISFTSKDGYSKLGCLSKELFMTFNLTTNEWDTAIAFSSEKIFGANKEFKDVIYDSEISSFVFVSDKQIKSMDELNIGSVVIIDASTSDDILLGYNSDINNNRFINNLITDDTLESIIHKYFYDESIDADKSTATNTVYVYTTKSDVKIWVKSIGIPHSYVASADCTVADLIPVTSPVDIAGTKFQYYSLNGSTSIENSDRITSVKSGESITIYSVYLLKSVNGVYTRFTEDYIRQMHEIYPNMVINTYAENYVADNYSTSLLTSFDKIFKASTMIDGTNKYLSYAIVNSDILQMVRLDAYSNPTPKLTLKFFDNISEIADVVSIDTDHKLIAVYKNQRLVKITSYMYNASILQEASTTDEVVIGASMLRNQCMIYTTYVTDKNNEKVIYGVYDKNVDSVEESPDDISAIIGTDKALASYDEIISYPANIDIYTSEYFRIANMESSEHYLARRS